MGPGLYPCELYPCERVTTALVHFRLHSSVTTWPDHRGLSLTTAHWVTVSPNPHYLYSLHPALYFSSIVTTIVWQYYLSCFSLECKLKEVRDFVLLKVTHIQQIDKIQCRSDIKAYTAEQCYNAAHGLTQGLESSHNQDQNYQGIFCPWRRDTWNTIWLQIWRVWDNVQHIVWSLQLRVNRLR